MNFEQQKNIIKSFLTEFNSFTEKEGVNTKLIAVSKKKPLQLIEVANKLGINHFGENYPQELRDKDLDKAKKNLDLSVICSQLCKLDPLFPPNRLWVEYYNIKDLQELIIISNKKKKIGIVL